MKKSRKIFYFFIITFIVLYTSSDVTAYFYQQTENSKLMFFVLGIIYLFFFVSYFRLVALLSGSQYYVCRDFSTIKISTSRWSDFFIKRHYLLIAHYGKNRVVSGVFFKPPKQILIFKDFFGKTRIMSLANVLQKLLIALVLLGLLLWLISIVNLFKSVFV